MFSAFDSCETLVQVSGIPEGVTDMSFCFKKCTNLTQAPVIPASVTDMSSCFSDCTKLTQAPVIPVNVTDMSFCFKKCTNLTQAPVIPVNVTDMQNCFYDCTSLKTIVLKCKYNSELDGSSEPYFKDAFDSCTSLTAGGIKVPAGQLATYKTNAAVMGVDPDTFAAE